MLKVGIVGCGKIADAHAAQLRRVAGCEIVGVCDREPLMARQLYERYPVKACYGGLAELLAQARPDVVHVTTPPASHFDIARQCLEAGCHVYVEKPFTINRDEAQQLIALAERKGCRITAGHDDQFRPAARRMRALVQSGFLGEGPLHMESYFGYELARVGYAGAMLGDKEHWVRKLPGKLLHNVISHGIARIAEFLTTESPQIIAHGFRSPFLRSMGVTEIIDELRVIVSEEQRVTAYFTFSSQMRPSLHQFRAYGSKNGLILDQDQETLIRLRGDQTEELRRALLRSDDLCQAIHGRRLQKYGRIPEDGPQHERRYEESNRAVLPLDNGRDTRANPLPRDSPDRHHHGRNLRPARCRTATGTVDGPTGRGGLQLNCGGVAQVTFF